MEITFDEWKKIQLKVAKILSVEDIPNKDKLYKIKISLGNEEKTTVAGIKPFYAREELLNKKVVVLTNLKPASIAGIKSEAMLLAAKDKDNKYRLIFADENIAEGTLVE